MSPEAAEMFTCVTSVEVKIAYRNVCRGEFALAGGTAHAPDGAEPRKV